MGDIVVAGSQWGRVKALLDEKGSRLDIARPSDAVEVVGLGGLPIAGDVFTVTEDESAAREIAAVRQQLGYLSDEQPLFAMTVARLLHVLSGYYPTWDAALVSELLERFELTGAQRVDALSRGAQTRLRIILALAHRPSVVLLDEPGLGLDLAARKTLLRTIIDVAGDGDRSVVLSSHRLEDVARITDRLLVLQAGDVVQDGPTDSLVEDHETLEERLMAWGAAG